MVVNFNIVLWNVIVWACLGGAVYSSFWQHDLAASAMWMAMVANARISVLDRLVRP